MIVEETMLKKSPVEFEKPTFYSDKDLFRHFAAIDPRAGDLCCNLRNRYEIDQEIISFIINDKQNSKDVFIKVNVLQTSNINFSFVTFFKNYRNNEMISLAIQLNILSEFMHPLNNFISIGTWTDRSKFLKFCRENTDRLYFCSLIVIDLNEWQV